MYEAFEYVSKNGILIYEDYRTDALYDEHCAINEPDLNRKKHLSDIGYVENNGRYN